MMLETSTARSQAEGVQVPWKRQHHHIQLHRKCMKLATLLCELLGFAGGKQNTENLRNMSGINS